jgi:hypothetical protein
MAGDNGKMFFLVSYIPVNTKNPGEESYLKKNLDKETFELQLPMVMIENIKESQIEIVSNQLQGSLIAYKNKQLPLLKISKFLNLYVFNSKILSSNASEIMMFHACRVEVKNGGFESSERSILLLINGHLNLNESTIHQLLGTNLGLPHVFKFHEFEDEDLCICHHLDFYLNECKVDYTIYFVASLVVLIISGNFVKIFLQKHL